MHENHLHVHVFCVRFENRIALLEKICKSSLIVTVVRGGGGNVGNMYVCVCACDSVLVIVSVPVSVRECECMFVQVSLCIYRSTC